jgi:hypothetical protein
MLQRKEAAEGRAAGLSAVAEEVANSTRKKDPKARRRARKLGRIGRLPKVPHYHNDMPTVTHTKRLPEIQTTPVINTVVKLPTKAELVKRFEEKMERERMERERFERLEMERKKSDSKKKYLTKRKDYERDYDRDYDTNRYDGGVVQKVQPVVARAFRKAPVRKTACGGKTSSRGKKAAKCSNQRPAPTKNGRAMLLKKAKARGLLHLVSRGSSVEGEGESDSEKPSEDQVDSEEDYFTIRDALGFNFHSEASESVSESGSNGGSDSESDSIDSGGEFGNNNSQKRNLVTTKKPQKRPQKRSLNDIVNETLLDDFRQGIRMRDDARYRRPTDLTRVVSSTTNTNANAIAITKETNVILKLNRY